MTRNIVKRAKAKSDLMELAGFIVRANLDAALRFIDAAVSAFQLLAETPDIGASRGYSNPLLQGLRMWPIRGFDKHLISTSSSRADWKSFVCYTHREILKHCSQATRRSSMI